MSFADEWSCTPADIEYFDVSMFRCFDAAIKSLQAKILEDVAR